MGALPNTGVRALKRIVLLVVAVHLVSTSFSAGPVNGQGLFESDGVLELKLRVPKEEFLADMAQRPVVKGSIEVEGGNTIPITATTYGDSRLEICTIPLMHLTIDPADARNTMFEGQEALWLVTPCRESGWYGKFVVLEYLTYKSYAVLADKALRVRPASVDIHDTEGSSKVRTRRGFFLEDIGLAAGRLGMAWLDVPSVEFEDLDPAQVTLMTLFQYMVGNTDFSAVSSRVGERCCHNMALFEADDDAGHTLVPFDFDSTGLVNAPYAVVDKRLGIERVTDRIYRGLCMHNEELHGAIAAFNEKRPELEALFKRSDLPYPKARKRALKYVDGFYRIINDPKKLEEHVVGACRE
jgi:hypothetical protein